MQSQREEKPVAHLKILSCQHRQPIWASDYLRGGQQRGWARRDADATAAA